MDLSVGLSSTATASVLSVYYCATTLPTGLHGLIHCTCTRTLERLTLVSPHVAEQYGEWTEAIGLACGRAAVVYNSSV